MKSECIVMENFDETACDAMLWQDSNANQNSQEQSLAEFQDSDSEGASSPNSWLEWDISNFNWEAQGNQANREDIYSQLNTPTRVQENPDWPNIDPLPILSSQSSSDGQSFTVLRPPSSTEEESEDFYPYSQSSDEKQIDNGIKVKPEPTAADSAQVPLGVVRPCYYPLKEEVFVPSTLTSMDDSDANQGDLLQQALSTTMITLPAKNGSKPITKREAPVNDKKMIPLMKKYKLDDNALSDMTLDRLKAKCRSNKNDYTTLSKYRRTCMNRYYARRSRNHKMNVTQTLEEQLALAYKEIDDLKATVEERDERIARLQMQLERSS